MEGPLNLVSARPRRAGEGSGAERPVSPSRLSGGGERPRREKGDTPPLLPEGNRTEKHGLSSK